MATKTPSKRSAPQAADYGQMLASSIDEVVGNKALPAAPTPVEKAAEAQADAAAQASKPKRTRGSDRVLSHPAGPSTKYPDRVPTDETQWTVPVRDSFTVAMAKLMAFRPGLTNAQISEIIHPVPAGQPTREGTTSVYYTWDLPRCGFGVERKAGGMHLLMPKGHSVDEIKSHPSPKLNGLLTSLGRKDILSDIEAYSGVAPALPSGATKALPAGANA